MSIPKKGSDWAVANLYYIGGKNQIKNSQCEGDHPYSQLDGNDLLPEVILGRMSIRSSTELATAVYKILNYEKK